mmetsp:Transcript_26222/g.66554  ORF Transcript_26222/g.66554 Transcript_26222/m.66554 type:complete len:470 (-) Transcript_26222:119-1528(-)
MRELVSGSAMLGEVHAQALDSLVDAQHACRLEADEHRASKHRHPRDNGQEQEQHDAEVLAFAVEEAAAGAAGVVRHREEGGGDASPEATAAVHSEGVEGIVDLELELESGPAKIHEAADDPDEHGVPGQHGGAARGDGDEAGEDPVAQRGEVPDVVQLLAGEHCDHPAEGGGERGADGGARGGGGVALGSDGEGRARVEAVPAHPQYEGAERLQHRGVTADGDGGAVQVEAPRPGPDDQCAPEGGDAAGHVHDARAGEVDDAAQVGVLVGGRRPAVRVPHPVHDDGVDEAGDDRGVHDIRAELRALGHRPRDDRGGGGSEDVLEPPASEVGAVVGVVVSDPSRGAALGAGESDEGVAVAGVAVVVRVEVLGAVRVRGAVPPRPPDESSHARIEQVLEQYVARVLYSDRPRLEHTEPSLHEEDQRSRVEQVEGVDRALEVPHFLCSVDSAGVSGSGDVAEGMHQAGHGGL